MNRQRFPAALSLSLTFILLATHWAAAAPLDDIVAAARKEGEIGFYAPTTLGPKGAQAIGEAFNKKYGLSVKLEYHPSANMSKEVAKVVGMSLSGVAPEWDLMVVTDAHHATLWLRKLHQAYDYSRLGIDRNLIHYDSGTVSFANQIVLPAYNSKVLAAKDAPKRWEDLLDPKWKGGKLGMSVATHHLSRLAAGPWGEERTTHLVKGLADQGVSLGRLGEIYNRLLLGEILVAISLTDSYVYEAKEKGAPVVHAEEVRPIISPAYHAGVLKGARQPNAGHLMALFLTTLEAQRIWEKYGGQTSPFVPGTPAHKYVQGKEVLYMDQSQARMIGRLARVYGKMLGF